MTSWCNKRTRAVQIKRSTISRRQPHNGAILPSGHAALWSSLEGGAAERQLDGLAGGDDGLGPALQTDPERSAGPEVQAPACARQLILEQQAGLVRGAVGCRVAPVL